MRWTWTGLSATMRAPSWSPPLTNICSPSPRVWLASNVPSWLVSTWTAVFGCAAMMLAPVYSNGGVLPAGNGVFCPTGTM